MARPSNRERILDAFEELLLTQGAGNATLDAVAVKAGVSKGGLIYHFPSKADLAAGFGERVLERVAESISGAPEGPEPVIRWYLGYELTDPAETAMWRSLIAALHGADEGLRQTVHDAVALYSQPLDCLDPALATHVRLLGDGIFFNGLIGLPNLDREQLGPIIDELVARIDGERNDST